jgi:hypothetical protein
MAQEKHSKAPFGTLKPISTPSSTPLNSSRTAHAFDAQEYTRKDGDVTLSITDLGGAGLPLGERFLSPSGRRFSHCPGPWSFGARAGRISTFSRLDLQASYRDLIQGKYRGTGKSLFCNGIRSFPTPFMRKRYPRYACGLFSIPCLCVIHTLDMRGNLPASTGGLGNGLLLSVHGLAITCGNPSGTINGTPRRKPSIHLYLVRQ